MACSKGRFMRSRSLSSVLLVYILIASLALAQEKAGKAPNAKANTGKAGKAEGILERLAKRKAAPAKPPLNDYVPCLFAGDEDFEMRARPNPYPKPGDPITSKEADAIVRDWNKRLENSKKRLDNSSHLLGMLTTLQDDRRLARRNCWSDSKRSSEGNEEVAGQEAARQ
jgi:hypothetical protein